MTTIAANEREDRLLTKKLDALDLQHRSQFLQMKKLMHYAKLTTERKFPELNVNEAAMRNGRQGHRHSLASISTHKGPVTKRMPGLEEDTLSRKAENTKSRLTRSISNDSFRKSVVSNEPRKSVVSNAFITGMRPRMARKESLVANEAMNEKESEELHNRLQYTEKEVVRIRKSIPGSTAWAGQKSQPVRKRTFLPHLENTPEISAELRKSFEDARNKHSSRKMSIARKQKVLPSLNLNSEKEESSSGLTGKSPVGRNSGVQFEEEGSIGKPSQSF